MYWLSKTIHRFSRLSRRFVVLLAVLGPGVITMVADNDAGGISTYAVTGSKYGFSLLWVFFILCPMAYYVQEMTVRLGAVTKRGHAEAIFEGFGSFWGWFSLVDLAIVNWLTLVTEYIGMTAAMRLFGVPPLLTVLAVTLVLFLVVITGQYWTFEKLTLLFCAFNLVYIPAAFWAMATPTAPHWSKVFDGLFVRGKVAERQNALSFVADVEIHGIRCHRDDGGVDLLRATAAIDRIGAGQIVLAQQRGKIHVFSRFRCGFYNRRGGGEGFEGQVDVRSFHQMILYRRRANRARLTRALSAEPHTT